ncbi:MAG: hypothetical protein KGM44_08250 [bacterium]|nr:hypothetical protein [bacterium]
MAGRYSRRFRALSNAFAVFGVPGVCLLLVGRGFRSPALLALGWIWLLAGLAVLAVWLRRRAV